MDITHIDSNGNAIMVDIGEKPETFRTAVATGRITMNAACFALVANGRTKKGDVLAVAQVAGIMAAKKTSDLIPLCHTLLITSCSVEFSLIESCAVEARCAVSCFGKTGAEMEALTGVSVALLTVYDMCKAVDKQMEVVNVRLLSKTGGKGG